MVDGPEADPRTGRNRPHRHTSCGEACHRSLHRLLFRHDDLAAHLLALAFRHVLPLLRVLVGLRLAGAGMLALAQSFWPAAATPEHFSLAAASSADAVAPPSASRLPTAEAMAMVFRFMRLLRSCCRGCCYSTGKQTRHRQDLFQTARPRMFLAAVRLGNRSLYRDNVVKFRGCCPAGEPQDVLGFAFPRQRTTVSCLAGPRPANGKSVCPTGNQADLRRSEGFNRRVRCYAPTQGCVRATPDARQPGPTNQLPSVAARKPRQGSQLSCRRAYEFRSHSRPAPRCGVRLRHFRGGHRLNRVSPESTGR